MTAAPDASLSVGVLPVTNAAAGRAAPACLLLEEGGVMLGSGGRAWGLPTCTGSEPDGSKSYDSAAKGSYRSAGGGLGGSGGRLLPVEALLAGTAVGVAILLH